MTKPRRQLSTAWTITEVKFDPAPRQQPNSLRNFSLTVPVQGHKQSQLIAKCLAVVNGEGQKQQCNSMCIYLCVEGMWDSPTHAEEMSLCRCCGMPENSATVVYLI